MNYNYCVLNEAVLCIANIHVNVKDVTKKRDINLFFERHPFVLINNDFASDTRKLKFFLKHCVKEILPTTKIEYKLSNVFFSSKLQ